MNKPIVRLFAALFALMFVVAACAGDSVQWTFAPVAISETPGSDGSPDASPSNPAEASVTDVQAGDAVPAESPAGQAGVQPATAGVAGTPDAPRVIELHLTGALQITDTAGMKVEDIPVTPGETVTFVVDNTAGFDHNFYIGPEGELSVPGGSTDTGIQTWATGTQELTWTVPDDVAGLQFGCTVAGHYTLMHGTFSVADGSAEPQPAVEPTASGDPAASMAPMGSMAPSESAAPAAGSAGTADKRVINLEATAALQFTQDGAQIQDIPVTPGETVVIRVDNTAGFSHNLYIGTDAELSSPNATTAVGIPAWETGVQFFEWQVPADITGLKFGCTVPGHYALMQGTISVSP